VRDALWLQSSDRDVDAAVAVPRRLRHDRHEARCFHDVVWNATGQYEAAVRPVVVLAHLVERERSSSKSEGAGQLHVSRSLADDGHHPDERAVVPVVEVVGPLVPERRQQVDAGELDEVVAAASSLCGGRVTRRRDVDVRRGGRQIIQGVIADLVDALAPPVQLADVIERRLKVVVDPLDRQPPPLLLLPLPQAVVGAARVPALRRRRVVVSRRRAVQTRLEDVHCGEVDGG